MRGGVHLLNATFREGPFAGNEIPLYPVVRLRGLTWDIVPKWLALDVTSRLFGPRRMDNDQISAADYPRASDADVKLAGNTTGSSGPHRYSICSTTAITIMPLQAAGLLEVRFPGRFAANDRAVQRLSACGPNLSAPGRRNVLGRRKFYLTTAATRPAQARSRSRS